MVPSWKHSELAGNSLRLDRVRSGARALLEPLGPEALNWRRAQGSWSLGECALHIQETNRLYLEIAEPVIRRAHERGRTATGPFRYNWFGRGFLSQVEPPPKGRLRAPKRFRPSTRDVDRGIAAELEASFTRLDKALETSDGLHLAKIKVASPVSRLLRFQLGICLSILVAHSERHVGQMKDVVAAPGFPGPV